MSMMLWIVVSTLACIGVAVMIGDFLFARQSRKLRAGNYRLITLYDDPRKVEEQMNRCLVRLTWHGPEGAILLVDMGMGTDALATCKRLYPELYGAFLCTVQELPDILRELDKMLARGN